MSAVPQNNAPADNQTIDGQITEVKKPDNALVMLNPEKFATILFEPFHDQLAAAKRKASREKYDIATKDGLAKAKEHRATFVTIRTTAEKAKTEAKRPIDESGKKILEHYKKLEEAAKAEEAKHAAAIDAEVARLAKIEQDRIEAERVRVENIENLIAHIRAFPATMAHATAGEIASRLQEMVEATLDPDLYQEQLEDAVRAQNSVIAALRDMHIAALAREEAARQAEADRAELARLKAEQAERERIAAIEQAERERVAAAERAAQVERERAFVAQQEAMAKQQRQMQEIMEIQALGTALAATQDRTRASLLAAVDKARAFEPGQYGAMAAMAKMARDAALPILESLLADMPEPAVEAAPSTAPRTLEQELASSVAAMAPTLGIDWHEPAPLADNFLTPSPVETPRVDDSAAVTALQAAVRDLYATRSPEEICTLVSDELDELEAGEGK